MNPITRRRLITTGLTAVAGASGLAAAARIADRWGLIPPDHGGLYGAGETLTYATQRLLMSQHSRAREFDRSQISRVAPVNGRVPESDDYQSLLRKQFEPWRLMVDGLVARPASFSLAELTRMPASTQITHQACEEGWSFIAEWTGVPLSEILMRVGVSPRAKYVAIFSFDDFWDSIDLPEAFHPQTLVAYAMNGRALPAGHGAPARLKAPRQLGYKNVKYLTQLTVVDSLADVGDGRGSSAPAAGYSWYAGI
jgi:DMSO/TMAO reductase YedYZ molybdopterin-dependent catalytic subunit